MNPYLQQRLSPVEHHIVPVTCDLHPGAEWAKPGEWAEAPPCFVCEPDWWLDHMPPPDSYLTAPTASAAEIMERR